MGDLDQHISFLTQHHRCLNHTFLWLKVLALRPHLSALITVVELGIVLGRSGNVWISDTGERYESQKRENGRLSAPIDHGSVASIPEDD